MGKICFRVFHKVNKYKIYKIIKYLKIIKIQKYIQLLEIYKTNMRQLLINNKNMKIVVHYFHVVKNRRKQNKYSKMIIIKHIFNSNNLKQLNNNLLILFK